MNITRIKRQWLPLLLLALMLTCTAAALADTESPCTPTSVPQPLLLGEGEKQFSFRVTDLEGSVLDYVINTDCETLGEALLTLELIAGDPGPYGLYVKTVQGITLDFDSCGHYWMLYINNEMAMTGVDTVLIAEGESYEFRAE